MAAATSVTDWGNRRDLKVLSGGVSPQFIEQPSNLNWPG
jgi:hypothetical protein